MLHVHESILNPKLRPDSCVRLFCVTSFSCLAINSYNSAFHSHALHLKPHTHTHPKNTRPTKKPPTHSSLAQLDPLGFGASAAAASVSLMAATNAVGTASAAGPGGPSAGTGAGGILPTALQCPAPFAFPFNPLGMGLFDSDPSRILAILHHQTLLAEEALR